MSVTTPALSRPTDSVDRRRDLVTALLCTWLIGGLVLDGWAHRNTPELESFFTPWHAVFYTGYLATATWIFKVSIVARDGRARVSPPPGYGLGLIGLVLFGDRRRQRRHLAHAPRDRDVDRRPPQSAPPPALHRARCS